MNVDRREDGSLVLSSPQPLGTYPTNLGMTLFRWAEEAPERTFIAERDRGGSWRRVTYAEAARASESVAQALLDRGLDQRRMVMVLAANGVDHALLTLGCLIGGVPICPVSPAYSLMSADYGRLRQIARLIEPALVYVDSYDAHRAALGTPELAKADLVSSSPVPAGIGATTFSELLATTATSRVRRRGESVQPEHIAKILFTSGSTAVPKGVVNTHRMLSANQQMLRQCWPFLEHAAPTVLDWLPWNHTFGGNHNFNMILRNGGTLYVDGGRPTPDAIGVTVANLREISPDLYFSVPAGYAALLPFLERDDELARAFLRELRLIFYAAAALPQDLWDRLGRLSRRHLGREVPMTSAWGCTETAPLAVATDFNAGRAGVIGLPVPGVEIKMVPFDERMELRVRGPNVTPGYYQQPDATHEAFDAEGFYRPGDAGGFVDPEAPEKGLVFEGRLAEDFKLGTGTWVHVGALRTAILAACSPALQDLVICSHDRDQLGVLAWLNVGACRDLAGRGDDDASLVRSPQVIEVVLRGIRDHNRTNPGASSRIARAHLMLEPPSIDANEITDKGYVNQRAVRERRRDLVARLFDEPPAPDVLSC